MTDSAEFMKWAFLVNWQIMGSAVVAGLYAATGLQRLGGSVRKIMKNKLFGWSEKGAMTLHTHGPIRTNSDRYRRP